MSDAAIVVVYGKVQAREGHTPIIIVSEVTPIDVAESRYPAYRY
jgi:hypothetical protein